LFLSSTIHSTIASSPGLFSRTTVFLPSYSSGNIKTNSIQPVSACLAFFYKWFGIFCSFGLGNPGFTSSGATPSVFPLHLVFFHFI